MGVRTQQACTLAVDTIYAYTPLVHFYGRLCYKRVPYGTAAHTNNGSIPN